MARHNTKQDTQQARVLGGFTLDGVEYGPNDIIEASPEMIKSLGASVDADPAAVEYCHGLDNPVIKKYEPVIPATAPEQQETQEQTN